MTTLTLLLGGARSGKSTAAIRLAESSSSPVTFIATSPRIDGDRDLDARIAAHRAERPSEWSTIEAEVELAEAIDRANAESMVVIDCLTVWLGNLMHHGDDDATIRSRSDAALAALARRARPAVAVTNEVGMGIVPADEMSRRYRDLLGRINQQWVAASDRAAFVVAGRALDLDRIETLR